MDGSLFSMYEAILHNAVRKKASSGGAGAWL